MQHQHTCGHCLRQFSVPHPTQRYCSDTCRTAAKENGSRNTRFHSRVKSHITKPPRENWRGWTDEEISTIRTMAGTATSAVIGAALGRTGNQIKHIASRYGISLRCYGEHTPWSKYSDACVEQARTLHDTGMKPKQIATILNIPYSAVRDFVYYKRGLGYSYSVEN